MKNFPAWWDTTITVFNRYENTQTNIISWYKTVLTNCFWKNDFQRLKMGDIQIQTDGIICRIPENKDFLEKQEWDKLPNDVMKNYFTLAQGDIIVKGSVDDNIDEYTSGSRSSDIVEKYKWQGCFVVDKLSINVRTGVGLSHYHVEGV